MQPCFKSIVQLIILGLLLATNANSQITPKKKGNGKERMIKAPKIPTIIDTFDNKNPNIDLSGAKKVSKTPDYYTTPRLRESSESIIKYFIEKRQYVNSFSFLNGNDTALIRLDKLLPKHTKQLFDFITRYNNQKFLTAELENGPFKIINDQINGLRSTSYKNRERAKFNQVFRQISELPNTKEKVELFINCAYLNISIKTYYEDVPKYCETAKDYADKIVNKFSQAKAYTLIGDFASQHKINDLAIQMYYLAREAMGNSNAPEKQKNNEQGELCDLLASVFYSLELEQATEKAGEYYNRAIEYYNKAENFRQADIDGMFTEDIAVTLWVNYWQFNQNKKNIELHNQNLNDLKLWLTEAYDAYSDFEVNYFALYSIAESIYKYNKQASLVYYLEALPYALFGQNIERCIYALSNVSRAFAATGKNDLSLKYGNLALTLSDSLKYNFQYDKSLLYQAWNYFDKKDFKTALKYSNDFILDSSKREYYYPSYYDRLLQEAYGVKYMSLDSLNMRDSAREYERKYTSYQTGRTMELVDLIYVDSKSASEWSDRTKDKSLESIKESESILKENLVLQHKLLDSARSLATRNEMLALKTEGVRKKDSISNVKNVAQEKKNTEDQKKLLVEQTKLTEKQKAFKNWVIVGSFIAAIILVSIILIGRSFYRLRIKERESALRIKESEVKRIDELARNKIHNIENDYSEIGVLLNSNQLDKLKLYTEEYESFLAAFLSNWKSDTIITLEDELVATERYCKVKAVLNNNFKYQIEAPKEGQNKIKFLQSVFDTLLDNTVRYNSQKSGTELIFNIHIVREENHIKCIVSDNGTPPTDDSKYLAEENSGLNLLKSRINNFYLGLNRKAPKDFFIVKSKNTKQGTEIQITLPYEEI